MDHNQLWDAIKQNLQATVASGLTYETFVGSLTAVSFEIKDNGTGVLYLTTSHAQVAEQWQQSGDYYQPFVQAAMQATMVLNGTPVFVQPLVTLIAAQTVAQPVVETRHEEQITLNLADTPEWMTDSKLDASYTFDSYVPSINNQEAVSVARSIAEHPLSTQWNPMFIYGDSGLGKTHLMQSIGNDVMQRNPNAKVKFITTEEFTNDWFDALRMGRAEEFKSEYRGVDLLLVDDVQFLSGNSNPDTDRKIQEEFFNTFNVITRNGHQIVMTSDKAPNQIAGVENRLVSRFSQGFTANITKPDVNARIGILMNEAEHQNVAISKEIIEEVAGAVDTNVRELKGVFNKIVAKAKFGTTEVTLKDAQAILESMNYERHRVITIPLVQSAVSEYFNVPVADIIGKGRTKPVVFARQVAMYLSREITQESLPQIGVAFGNKDHTTVMHSTEKIAKLVDEDNTVERQLQAIRTKLTE